MKYNLNKVKDLIDELTQEDGFTIQEAIDYVLNNIKIDNTSDKERDKK